MSDIKGIKPRIKIERLLNPNTRSYSFPDGISLLEQNKFFFFNEFLLPQYEHYLDKKVRELGERLSNIPGVTNGYFHNCLGEDIVYIIMGDAFKWKDIESLVLDELVKVFYPEATGSIDCFYFTSHEREVERCQYLFS